MRNLRNIDIRKINSNGRYIDVNIPLMFELTDEEIMELRRIYNNPNIARDRLQRREVRVERPKKRVYKAVRNNPYDNRGKIKNGVKVFVRKFIIGGVVVCLAISLLPNIVTNEANVSYADERSNNSGYTSTYEGVGDLSDYITIGIQDVVKDGKNVNDEESTINEEVVVDDVNQERCDLVRDICNIYQVNYDVVYPKIEELSNDFMDDNYLNGHIDGVLCKGEEVYANTEEELLVYTIRCMKQLPDILGVDTSNLYINNGYQSGDNYYEQIDRVSRVLGIDRCLMYAIVQSECGFNSEMFNTINNPAGLKDGNGQWWEFSTKEEGFFELGMEILKYYRMIGKDPSQIDEETLSQIRDIHAPLSDGNDYWLPNVISCLNYAKENESMMFDVKSESNGLSY